MKAIDLRGRRLSEFGIRMSIELAGEIGALCKAMQELGPDSDGQEIDEAILANLDPLRAAHKRTAIAQRRARVARGRIR